MLVVRRVGAEYRRETNRFQADPLVEQGFTFYNALAGFDPPAFEVKEAFGELSVPLVKDVFLLKELTLSGAARVADYKGGAGTVFATSGLGGRERLDGLHTRMQEAAEQVPEEVRGEVAAFLRRIAGALDAESTSDAPLSSVERSSAAPAPRRR